MAADASFTVHRVRPLIRVSLRLRLRYAWMRWRLGPEGRRIADAAAEAFDRQVLGL